MTLFIFSALLVVASNVTYHICQKTIPTGLHPIFSICLTFFTALVGSLLLLPFFLSKNEILLEIPKINLSPILLGLTIVGIDLGYLLFYRSGWSMSTGPLFTYVTLSILLIPIGLLFFHEVLNLTKTLGVLISITGLWLLIK